MKLLLQRATAARVQVDAKTIGAIGRGLVVFAAFGREDNLKLPSLPVWQQLIAKTLELRIFPDNNEKMNLGLREYGGELLLVSQFTLYADCRKGRRPSFSKAAPPDEAAQLYHTLVTDFERQLPGKVRTGMFGAHMYVTLTNWGPITIELTSDPHTA